MSLDAAFGDLVTRLTELERAFDDLLWAIQAQPEAVEWRHALADHYDGVGHELMGLTKEAMNAAAAAQAATSGRVDALGARQALLRCHERWNKILDCFYGDPGSFDRRSSLREVIAEAGRWVGWARGVEDAISRCPQPLHEVGAALPGCWHSLTDHASRCAVTAQATYTGPQIYFTRRTKERHG